MTVARGPDLLIYCFAFVLERANGVAELPGIAELARGAEQDYLGREESDENPPDLGPQQAQPVDLYGNVEVDGRVDAGHQRQDAALEDSHGAAELRGRDPWRRIDRL